MTEARPVILGVTEHFRPGEHGRVEAGMRALASLGVRHIRIELPWAHWHDADLRQWQEWLIATLSRQLTVLPSLVYLPPPRELVSPLGGQTVPRSLSAAPVENPKAFADFLDALAERFAGTLEWVELPSGPADPEVWDWRLDPRGHVFCQIIASAAYRCRQRGLKTVLGGIRPGDLGWLSLMCENGALDFTDAVGLQDDAAQPWDRPGRAETIRDAKRVLAEHGRHAEVWITAAGASTNDHDEFAQLEAFLRWLGADAERVYWSSLQDVRPRPGPPVSANYYPREGRTGLLRSNGTPKLLFRLWNSQGIEGVRQIRDYASNHRPGCAIANSGRDKDPKSDHAAEGGRPLGAPNAQKRVWEPLPAAVAGIRQAESSTRSRPVLITGGAGFIGANLAERLLNAGRPVIILDNLSRAGVEHNAKGLCETYEDLLEVYVGDVRNKDIVEKLVARCQRIFHFAAQVAVTTSLLDPVEDFESNLQGTLNVLEAARRQDPAPPLLFASTHKVYGDLRDVELIPVGKRQVPREHRTRVYGIDESRRLDFHSPYGCSKGAADQYVLDYARIYGLPNTVLRLSCIYGRRQLGTQDQGWVTHFALQMLRDAPLNLCGDGRQVRDILYIDDLLDALLAALENIEATAGRAFNIGGGPRNAVSLLEVVSRLSELSGVEPQIHHGPRRQGDQPYYVSDVRRFSAATGWTPQVSPARGIARLYHWILENVQPGVLGLGEAGGPLRVEGTLPNREDRGLGTLQLKE